MPDGKIICSSGPFAMRFLADGSVDLSFGNNGILSMPTAPNGYYESRGLSNVLRSDGIIVGANTVLDFNFSYPSLGVVAYDTSGVVDSTFGNNGYLQDFAGGIAAYSVRTILQSDNKVIIAGNNPNGIHITRVTTSGQIDTTFGISGYWDFSPGGELFALIKLNNNHFFVGYRLAGTGNFFRVFDSNGALDNTFSLNGSNNNMGDLGILNVALVESNGDITFGGTSLGFPYRISRLVKSSAIPTITLNGDTLFSNVADNSCTYQWYMNGNLIEGANNSNYSITANGNYSVQVSNIWGCSTSDEFNVISLGANRLENLSISVFPIPATNTLNVQFQKTLSKVSIVLTDLTGKIVLEKQVNNTSGVELIIRELASGIYTLQVISDQGNSNRKIVIE